MRLTWVEVKGKVQEKSSRTSHACLHKKVGFGSPLAQQLKLGQITGPVLIVVGIKKEKEKNSQKGKKRREKKGFLEIYHVVL